MSKILLDYGHTLSGADTGAQGCGYREENCTRDVGRKVKEILEANGHTVVVVSCDSANSLGESLAYRVNKANTEGGDLFVSIHLNAFNGEAYGSEVYTYGAKEIPEAKTILKNLAKLGYYNRGIKNGSGLYVIKNTSMRSMLVECCFIDNYSDMSRYSSYLIAKAIAEGVMGKSLSDVESPVGNNKLKNWCVKLQTECNKQGFSSQIVDGIPGINTLNGCPLVRFEAQGNITKLLQERLNNLGYSTNGVDGIFGSGTKNAVIRFQRDSNLVEDGIVGRETWRKLLKL